MSERSLIAIVVGVVVGWALGNMLALSMYQPYEPAGPHKLTFVEEFVLQEQSARLHIATTDSLDSLKALVESRCVDLDPTTCTYLTNLLYILTIESHDERNPR